MMHKPSDVVKGPSSRQYHLKQNIGAGGYGLVRKAEADRQQYAAKIIRNTNRDSGKDEIKILEGLKHPNVVYFQQGFWSERLNSYVLIMEFCANGSLDKYIERLEGKNSVELMLGIAKGVKFIHDKLIVHKDLKPENILMQGAVPKIADFGISRILATAQAKSTKNIGTQRYMAPELLHDGKFTQKVDIWALGLIFLEMDTGKRLNCSPYQIQNFHNSEHLMQIRHPAVYGIVFKMLQENHLHRPSIANVVDELERLSAIISAPKPEFEHPSMNSQQLSSFNGFESSSSAMNHPVLKSGRLERIERLEWSSHLRHFEIVIEGAMATRTTNTVKQKTGQSHSANIMVDPAISQSNNSVYFRIKKFTGSLFVGMAAEGWMKDQFSSCHGFLLTKRADRRVEIACLPAQEQQTVELMYSTEKKKLSLYQDGILSAHRDGINESGPFHFMVCMEEALSSVQLFGKMNLQTEMQCE